MLPNAAQCCQKCCQGAPNQAFCPDLPVILACSPCVACMDSYLSSSKQHDPKHPAAPHTHILRFGALSFGWWCGPISRATTSVTSATFGVTPVIWPEPGRAARPRSCSRLPGPRWKRSHCARGSTLNTQGEIGWPVSLAHNARTSHNPRSNTATANRQPTSTSPASSSEMRNTSRKI